MNLAASTVAHENRAKDKKELTVTRRGVLLRAQAKHEQRTFPPSFVSDSRWPCVHLPVGISWRATD